MAYGKIYYLPHISETGSRTHSLCNWWSGNDNGLRFVADRTFVACRAGTSGERSFKYHPRQKPTAMGKQPSEVEVFGTKEEW